MRRGGGLTELKSAGVGQSCPLLVDARRSGQGTSRCTVPDASRVISSGRARRAERKRCARAMSSLVSSARSVTSAGRQSPRPVVGRAIRSRPFYSRWFSGRTARRGGRPSGSRRQAATTAKSSSFKSRSGVGGGLSISGSVAARSTTTSWVSRHDSWSDRLSARNSGRTSRRPTSRKARASTACTKPTGSGTHTRASRVGTIRVAGGDSSRYIVRHREASAKRSTGA